MSDYIKREDAEQALSDAFDTVPMPIALAHGILENVPSADVEPVRHGRWKTKKFEGDYFPETYCSECGQRYAVLNLTYDYCPNCGARMDGEEE